MLIKDIYERAKARGVHVKTLVVLERLESIVARDPNDTYAYVEMGHLWHLNGNYAVALELYNKVIALDSRFAYALCYRADLLATCPEAQFRDGVKAVADATLALNVGREEGFLQNDWRHRMFLRVLAAAYAEIGDFTAAMEAENEALAFTVTKRAARTIKHYLSSYRSQVPIRKKRGVNWS